MSDPQVNLKELTKPFPKNAIKQRAVGGGRMLSYIEGHAVIHRLNDATDNVWDMEVKEIDSRPFGKPNDRGVQPVLMTARLALTLPGLGTREGIGVQVYYEGTGEDLVKGCVTDALKKAATLFGVGLELYGSDYEGDDARTVPEPRSEPQSQPQTPSANPDQITTPQIRKLFALAKQAGLTEDNFKQELKRVHGVEHVNQISKQAASSWIDQWERSLNGSSSQERLVPAGNVVERGEPGNDRHSR